MSFKIKWEEKGIICAFDKAFTCESLLQSNQEISEDHRFTSIKYSIHDFSSVESFPIKSSTIREIAYIDAELYKINPNIKLAIVGNKAVMKGLAQMFKTYFEIAANGVIWDTVIFETLEDARVWVAS